MNALYPICPHKRHLDRWLRPMRGRIAFRCTTARLTATDHNQGAHLTINISFLGSANTKPTDSIDTDLGTGTIQIAIAGGKG